MRLIRIILLIGLVFSTFRPAAAQAEASTFAPGAHLRFEHLNIDDGLSQNAGLALLQDSQGYLWIGTQDGLNRYDGYSITHFKHNSEDPATLSHNSILELYEDTNGSLWIGTWGGGLNRLDLRGSASAQGAAFTRFEPDPANPASLSHPIVTSIVQDEVGTLWVGTLGGLDRFDPTSSSFTHYRHDPANPDTLSSDAISMIIPDGNGKLWVGTGAFSTTGAGLNLFDPATGRAQRFAADGDCLAAPNIADILPAPDGSLWIAFGGYGVTGGGIDHYNPADGACTHYDNASTFDNQITDNNVTDLVFDRSGVLWATSWSSGVWRMAPGEPFIGIHHNPSDPESLSNDNTFSLLLDRSGVLWIGTLSAGINKLNLETLQFRTYRTDALNPQSLPSNHVGAFAQTRDGSIWVGTWESGLARFDPARGVFTVYQNDPANPQSLSSDLVMSLYGDSDGSLWVGTLGGGLNHFDPSSGLFTRFQNDPADPASLLENQVTNITRDPAGRLWVGSFAGLSRLDPGAEGFVNYPMAAPPVSFQMIGTEMWIGTWGGGVFSLDLNNSASLDPAQASFTNLANDPKNPNSLSQNGVWSIHASPDGKIWLATEGGLNRYDPQTGQFKHYTEKDGLRNATILGILADSRGYLWLTTNNGLAKFDPQSESFHVFDKSDGLQGNEFNSNAYFQSAEGLLFVGGVSGFTVFDPLKLSQNIIEPPVVITQFSIFNNPQPFNALDSAPIRLNYNQNFISFEFAALDFHAPRQNQYAYMLEGFDQTWIEAGTRNYVSYTNLPGGEYTFRVRAASSSGVWNETGASLPLTVTPPFWMMWPFQLGLFLGIVSLIVLGFQWRVRSVRQQNALLQGMVNDQRRTESELRQSEARFKAMFDNTAVGVALMSLDRRIVQVNPTAERLTGYTGEEIAVINPSDLVIEEDRYLDRDLFLELVAGRREQYLIEKRYMRKDGSIFWGRVNFALVRDAAQQPGYIVGIIEDITEEKHAAERLAAQADEHRRLLEKRIAERTDELNMANERLRVKAAQDAVTAERTRLARDLHDAVTQTLFSTTLIADVLPEIWQMNPDEGRRRLEEVRQLTRGALAEMRTLLVELRPNALIEVPLPTLLRQLTEAMTGRSRISIQLNIDGSASPTRKLPADVQVSLYRIAQEALNNVVKHAKASHAVVTLHSGDQVRLTVADDGAGFDPAVVTADHLGLKIMRERAEAIGAKFIIYSEPGEGTHISVVWGPNPAG